LVVARSAALRSVRGVDASLPPTLALIDLCLRLQSRGLRFVELSDVLVHGEPFIEHELAGWPAHALRWRDIVQRTPPQQPIGFTG
jgi:hypothetical protein